MQEYNEHTIRNVIHKLLQGELIRDEEILWTGQPDPSVIFSKADYFLVPFTVVLTAIVIVPFLFVGNNASNGANATNEIPMFYYIFLIMSVLDITIGRFIRKNRKKKHTFYAITNKRAFILYDNIIGKTKELRIDTLHVMSRNIRSDGHGTIYFGEDPGMYEWFENSGMEQLCKYRYGYISPFAFFDIRNAAAVYGLVTRLIQERNNNAL